MRCKAFAPATVANVAVGFDILGFPVDGVGDEVEVSVLQENKNVEITEITGMVKDLPMDPEKNTATVALKKMITDLGLNHGFLVKIKKGIPLGSGMGGSAASAVAAVVAANGLLKKPLSSNQLLEFALAGEAVASGAVHGDNVGPCLFGGLTLLLPTTPMEMISIPVPSGIFSVLVHPDLIIETRQARARLHPVVTLEQHTRQSALLAGFIAGCFKQDIELIQQSMRDVLIEPQRSQLIPGFDELKSRALDLGALGFGISGSGPSVFAWSHKKDAKLIQNELIGICKKQGLACTSWISPIGSRGARIIP